MQRDFRQQGSEFYSNSFSSDRDGYVEERILNEPAEAERVRTLMNLVPLESRSLLDVGAGFGVFLYRLTQERDLRVAGVDISQECLSWGQERNLDLRVASAHDLPFEDRSFDTIVCSEVLEHLQYGVFEQSLQEISRVAGDTIIISVPYDERRGLTTCPYCGAKSNPDYHHRSFKVQDLADLFPDFELQSTLTVGQLSALTTLKSVFGLPWSARMLCPACFYKDERKTTLERDRRFDKVKRFLRGLPFPTRPRWLVGVFTRSRVAPS